ncbi:YeeE/YedE family protein [Roseovarius sp. M141]|uniref:YeeE/YedE family protein n=1 Tax=Roseovarius sp. M141 TaxID=2583806 RepID=UPI0020CE052B|nr:YeeE/YedE family protein [Roseovarius sp. M141]MCQ0092339.1 YeeE/YedE family protein [Roseovarius sp. M141]
MLPITQTDFTPWASLGGGVLIGLSAVMVMALFGRIAGIVGITAGAAAGDDRGWRIAFIAGLIAAPLLWLVATGAMPQQTVSGNLPGMAIAGLLVGAGTALGSGCTSGHGVCGLARLSGRSLAAVITFMAFAAGTVFVLRHAIGGAV